MSAMEFSPSQQRMSKMSMMPPVTPHSARDSVRNSVLQVRNYTDDEYAQHPPPPFQQDQDYNGDDDVVEDMNLEIDTTHASVVGAQNGYASGVHEEEGFYDDRQTYGRRDTYDDVPQEIQTPFTASYSPMDLEVPEKKKKKWKGRVGGLFKGIKRRVFRRGKPADNILSDDTVLGRHSAVPAIHVSEHASRNGDRPYSRASASTPYTPQRPGLGAANNETTFYSTTDAPMGVPPQSQPVTMLYVDPDQTDGGGGTRSRHQSYVPPTRQASLKREDDEDDDEYRHPEDIHRSASHVSHASQRSHLSDPSTARNVHRERVPNPQVPPSLMPSVTTNVQFPIPMPYIPPPPPPPSARKTPSSSRHTSRSRSYFSSEISSPIGHYLHFARLVRDIRQMPWLATGGRITSGYVPKYSSARAKERMSRSRRVQAEMEHISGGGQSWYTPSPKQREKMEKNQRRRDKYLKHHDHDHDAVQRTGKGSSSRRHHDRRTRHFSSNSTTPGQSTPSREHSRRHSSKARRHRSSFRNGFPYYMPSSQNAFTYPYPYNLPPMYMVPSPLTAPQPVPGPSSGPPGRPTTAMGAAQLASTSQGGLAPPDKGRASRPVSVASRMTVTQDSHRRPARELPTPPQGQAPAYYMIPTFMSPPGSPVPSGQAGIPFPQPMPFPYPPPSAWTGVPPPTQQPNPASG